MATWVARAARLPQALLVVYAAIWTALAIEPSRGLNWLLEDLVVAIALPLLLQGYRHLRFSNGSYIAIFVFTRRHRSGAAHGSQHPLPGR